MRLSSPILSRDDTVRGLKRGPSTALLLVTLALLVRLSFMVIAHGIPFGESTGPYPALFQNECTAIGASVANGYGYESPFLGSSMFVFSATPTEIVLVLSRRGFGQPVPGQLTPSTAGTWLHAVPAESV